MITVKSYTGLEQSKKLAEILPPESADYCWGIDDETLQYNSSPYPCAWKDYTCKEYYIPCWSLAALISVLPLEIDTHKQTDGHKTYYYVELYMKRMGKEIYLSTERHENLVDACVAMIEKLHKLNLL